MRAPFAGLLCLLISALVLAGLPVQPALAHVRSESHSTWEISGGNVDLIMTIPKLETQRLGKGGAQPTDQQVEAYLAERVYPLSNGVRCPIEPPIEALSAAQDYRKFDFTFKCPSGANLQIHSGAFFDLVPSHTNFSQIQNEASATSPNS